MIDPLRPLALLAIRLYQRWLSPAKGFSCAYRIHTGRSSCSVLGYRAVRRHGVFRGLGLLRRRLDLCGEACRRHHAKHARHALPAPRVTHHAHPRLHAQRGFVDAGCDAPCDSSCDSPCDASCDHSCGVDLPDACDVCDCGDAGDVGDCGSRDDRRRRRRRHGDLQYVHLPPHRR